MFWTALVDALRAVIFSVAHVCNGSLGLATCLVSFGVRLVLLPWSVRLARRALAHQRRLAALKPQMDRLNERFAADPQALWRERGNLLRRHGLKEIDAGGLLGGLVQVPILGAFFAALRGGTGVGVRFLWIRDLARPNVGLMLVVTALTVLGVGIMPGPQPDQRVALVPLIVTAAFTLWLLSSASALFALASGAGMLVNVVQAVLVRRGSTIR